MRSWAILFFAAALAAAPSSHAQQKDSAQRLDLRSLEKQLDLAPSLRALNLSPEQVAEFQKLAAPVADALRQYRAALDRDDLRSALLKARDAALLGEEADRARALWEARHSEARELLRSARSIATRSATNAFASLTPAQRIRLGLKTLSKKILNAPASLAEARGYSPADWEKWRDQLCRRVAADLAGKNPAPDVQVPFLAFCERACNMPADEFAEKAATLSREWRGLLLESLTKYWGKRHDEDVQRELEDWFATEGFDDTLARLAALLKETK